MQLIRTCLESGVFGCQNLKFVRTRPEDFAVSPKLSGRVCNSSELVRSDGRRTVWKLQLVRTRPDAIANLQSDRTSLTFFFVQNTFNYTSASEQSPNSSARVCNLSEFIRRPSTGGLEFTFLHGNRPDEIAIFSNFPGAGRARTNLKVVRTRPEEFTV